MNNTLFYQVSRIGLTLLLFSALAVGPAAWANNSFRVCADPMNPPFSDKTHQGYENKIAELFAQKLDQTVEYTWFPQRIGFIRNTLKAKLPNSDEFKCDVVMGLPTGYELTLTTNSYYRSVYGMIYRTGQGLDDIKNPLDLIMLPAERREKLRIAMFDRGPGTAWIVKNGFVEQGIPYQSMTGDPSTNTALTIEKDFNDGKIDIAILWGPMAGHLISNSPTGSYTFLPMLSTPSMKFDFQISMGVRFGDKDRKAQLNALITENSDEIRNILQSYNVPLIDESGQLLFTP